MKYPLHLLFTFDAGMKMIFVEHEAEDDEEGVGEGDQCWWRRI